MEQAANWQSCETLEIKGAAVQLGRGRLIQQVFEACDVAGWQTTFGDDVEVTPAVLKSVVVYCLARNLCSADEIVASCEDDVSVRYLCSNRLPSWQTVHEFRRRNATVIRDCLTRLFSNLPGTRVPITLARAEADARLHRAIHADSIVLDL